MEHSSVIVDGYTSWCHFVFIYYIVKHFSCFCSKCFWTCYSKVKKCVELKVKILVTEHLLKTQTQNLFISLHTDFGSTDSSNLDKSISFVIYTCIYLCKVEALPRQSTVAAEVPPSLKFHWPLFVPADLNGTVLYRSTLKYNILVFKTLDVSIHTYIYLHLHTLEEKKKERKFNSLHRRDALVLKSN